MMEYNNDQTNVKIYHEGEGEGGGDGEITLLLTA